MFPLILDVLGALGIVLLLAARRRRAQGDRREVSLRRVGGILLGVAAIGRMAVGLASLGRPHG